MSKASVCLASGLILLLVLTVAGCTSANRSAKRGAALAKRRQVLSTTSSAGANQNTEELFSGATSETKPVDVDGNGRIDAMDLGALMSRYNALFRQKIKPVLAKIGAETDENGEIANVQDAKDKLAKLPIAEAQQFYKDCEELQKLDAQIKANAGAWRE